MMCQLILETWVKKMCCILISRINFSIISTIWSSETTIFLRLFAKLIKLLHMNRVVCFVSVTKLLRFCSIAKISWRKMWKQTINYAGVLLLYQLSVYFHYNLSHIAYIFLTLIFVVCNIENSFGVAFTHIILRKRFPVKGFFL